MVGAQSAMKGVGADHMTAEVRIGATRILQTM